jgi:hypothetical protein
LAIVYFRWGFGSGFLGWDAFGCFGSGACSMANASRFVFGDASAVPIGAGPFAPFVTAPGTIVGRPVSNTTRSGHFRSVWIRIGGKSVPAPSGTGIFGKTPFTTNISASKTPPTKQKYRAKGIAASLHSRRAGLFA